MTDKTLRRRALHDEEREEEGKKVPGSPKSPQRRKRNIGNAHTPTDKKINTPKSNLYPSLSDNETDEETDEVDHSPYNTRSVKDRLRKKSPVSPRLKQKQSDQKEETPIDASWSPLIILVIIGIICIGVGGLYLFIFKSNVPQKKDIEVDYYKLYSDKFTDFPKKYPAQSSRFWKLVNAPLRRLLTTGQSDYPAVILFVVPKNAGKTAECFTQTLVKMLNRLYNIKTDPYIDASGLSSSSSPAQVKLSLDKKLQQVLSSSKGVIIDHLEMLPAEASLLLHGYCDGDNAPFKESVIILLFHSDKEFDDLDEKTFEDHLTVLWEPGLGADEMPALLSRIANNVAIIKQDKSNC